MPFDCFVSYASPDLAFAEALHRRLVAAGFSVWFDKARLKPGCDWHREIEQGCEASRVVLPVLTPRWQLSEWTRFETYGAEAAIPLVVEGRWEDVATPPLGRFQNQALDFASADDAAWQRLFMALRELLARPAPEKAERVAHLRFPPNPHFVGREAKLNELHEKLFRTPTAALTQGRVEAIAALGGVGKTTLAREYAEKFWRCYPQMFWVDCRLGLQTEFARLCDILFPDLQRFGLDDETKAGRVRQEFNQAEGRPARLLVLDNAEDEDSVLPWVPKTGTCHTIITSRYTAWSPGIETCHVWVLEKGPARELLLRRAGRTADEADLDACDALAAKLGYLPLALEQAAGYIANQGPGFGFAQYLRLYAESEKELLALRSSGGSTEYPDAVFTTWRTTIAKLPAGARAILRLVAFMAPTPIRVKMFITGAVIVAERAEAIEQEAAAPPAAEEATTPPPGEFQIRQWKDALVRYSMAAPQADDAFSVHALVQAVERHQTPSAAQPRSVEQAMQILSDFAPQAAQRYENWPIWKILLPHAEALWLRLEQDDRITPDADLLMGLALYLLGQGRYADAEGPARRTLEVRERVLGPEHPDTLTSVNNLAFLLERQGDYAAAEPLYRRALEAFERAVGPEHPVTLTSVNNLAGLLKSKGDYEAAEPLYRRALEARERVLGPEHPSTLTSVNNLAGLLESMGNYAAAEPLERRALGALERVLGPEHPDTLTSTNNLAALLESKGDYAAAEPLYRRALEAHERVLGPEHPDTLTSVSNLAALLETKGDYAAAEPLERRALEARERVLGPEHPSTLTSVNNLAFLLQSKGDYAAAEPLFRRALEASERVLGPDHPTTLTGLNNLGALLYRKGDYTAAEPLLLRALEARERVLGPNHLRTLLVLSNLADLLEAMGEEDEARRLREEHDRRMRRSQGEGDP